MHRLFVALRPPPSIRALLAATMTGVPHVRWQDDTQLHLTLRYIGAVDRPTARTSRSRSASSARPRSQAGRRALGRRRPARRAHRPSPQGRSRARAAGASDGGPRAYLPHVTLARLPRGAGVGAEIDRWRADHAGLASPRFDLDQLILYESRPGASGSAYEVIARWPLG